MKLGLYLILASIALLLAAALIVSNIDLNRYKPEIQQWISTKTGRTFKLNGDIRLSVFPRIGIELGETTISERNQKGVFLRIASSDVSVALLPLLMRHVQVDGIRLHGLKLQVSRDQAGSLNLEDLFPNEKPSAPGSGAEKQEDLNTDTALISFDVKSVNISDAEIRYKDSATGVDWTFSQISLHTGQIASQGSGQLSLGGQVTSQSQQLNSQIKISSQYSLELQKHQISLTGTKISAAGTWSGAAIDATLQAVNLSLTSSTIISQSSKLLFNHSKGPQKIQLNADLPKWSLASGVFNALTVSLQAKLQNAARSKDPITLSASGNVTLDTRKKTAATGFKGSVDGHGFDVSVQIKGFINPSNTFDLSLDEINVDRYIDFFKQTEAKNPTDQATGKTSNTKASTLIPHLSLLNGSTAQGKIEIGKLSKARLTAQDIQSKISLTEGRLVLGPHSATLFGGKLAGTLWVDSQNQIGLKESLTGVQINDLLQALELKPLLTGTGSLVMDVTSQATDVDTIKENLSGKASFDIKNGALQGIDVGAILSATRAALGSAATKSGVTQGQTTFTQMSATANIKSGVLHNSDLKVLAPVFSLQGAGTVNLIQLTLDYLIKVAVAKSQSTPMSTDLLRLIGVEVPIHISGDISAPKYEVDVAALAAAIAKSSLTEGVPRAVETVVPGLGNALKGLIGR